VTSPEAAQPESTTPTTAGAPKAPKAGAVIRRAKVTFLDKDNIDFLDGVVENGYAGDVMLNGIDPQSGNLYTIYAMAKVAGPTTARAASKLLALVRLITWSIPSCQPARGSA
jgi:hypothetical protein